jgi:hypothetical protein
MTQYDDGGIRRLCMFPRDQASGGCANTKRLVVVVGDLLDPQPFGLVAKLHRRSRRMPAEHLGEESAFAADAEEQRIGEQSMAPLLVPQRQLDQPLRVADWQRVEEQRVDHAEHGRVRPDSESERQDGSQRKSRIP